MRTGSISGMHDVMVSVKLDLDSAKAHSMIQLDY